MGFVILEDLPQLALQTINTMALGQTFSWVCILSPLLAIHSMTTTMLVFRKVTPSSVSYKRLEKKNGGINQEFINDLESKLRVKTYFSIFFTVLYFMFIFLVVKEIWSFTSIEGSTPPAWAD